MYLEDQYHIYASPAPPARQFRYDETTAKVDMGLLSTSRILPTRTLGDETISKTSNSEPTYSVHKNQQRRHRITK